MIAVKYSLSSRSSNDFYFFRSFSSKQETQIRAKLKLGKHQLNDITVRYEVHDAKKICVELLVSNVYLALSKREKDEHKKKQ